MSNVQKRMYKGNWTCRKCGQKIDELPFKPKNDKDVYCHDCQKQHLKDQDCYFEVLVTDTQGKVVIKNKTSFCHSLLSNTQFWKDAKITDDKNIIDESKQIKLKIKELNIQDDDQKTELRQAYTLTISGDYDSLESFRVPFLQYLKMLQFDFLYVLEDDISRIIADGLYSGIYRVESFLRKYVIKFFAIRLGSEWWKLTADSDMKKKITQRKNNEIIFSEFINNEVYLIDFGELGKLIYLQSSGNLSKDDMVEKILNIDETKAALVKLKQEVQTNYNKFFKDTFKKNDFQNKWQELEKIRHKVAHNSLFTSEDEQKGKELTRDLIGVIEIANNEIEGISFNDTDKQSIISNFVSLKYISEKELLDELNTSLEWARNYADGFVGFQNFVHNILGNKGYESQHSKDLIRELESKKILEIYTFKNEKTEHGVAAIRSLK